jgi:putative ATP-dependent endonuclease of OLD family
MRLCKFEINNFKGIRNASFDWEDLVVLIGENNAGKSTVLQAIQCYLGGSNLKDQAFFSEGLSDLDHAMELIGHFSHLSPVEQQAPAVRGRMLGDKWILKKKFWSEVEEEGERSWKEQYYSLSPGERFINWPAADNAWGNFPGEYEPLIDQIAGRGARPSGASREQLRELVRQQRPDLVGQGEPAWVANPGGGGNWKSNANSIVPRWIYVKAVHDAIEESTSKEASSYGRIVSLIVEKKLMNRVEVVELRQRIQAVLRLFNPDPNHPEVQAEEIREVQDRINAKLNQVIGGTVAIRTSEIEIEPMLLPSTRLVLKDRPDGLETSPTHQGHGLQRTLVMTLLQILAEIQTEPAAIEGHGGDEPHVPRPVVLAVEEPELYMHPQMERKMRDVLYQLSVQPGFQIICTTHSPVFLDIRKSHKTIVRVVKGRDKVVSFHQVGEEIFPETDPAQEKERLRLIATFNPTLNEVFFAKRVVLLEEESAIVAFERLAELTGLFLRHPHLRHDVALIDCRGKGNIPLYQRVLNHFEIPYSVIHDEDQGNPLEAATNLRVEGFLATPTVRNVRHMLGPHNLEGLLGYAPGKDKPYKAMKRVEDMHAAGTLPLNLQQALNWVYFGQGTEPVN